MPDKVCPSLCARYVSSTCSLLQVQHIVCNYGQRYVGEMVRKTLKNVLTDSLQLLYNRTGTHGKKKFPDVLEKCIYCKFDKLPIVLLQVKFTTSTAI